jgi:hypothetical protein
VICGELNPMCCQPPALIEQYGEAIAKVFGDRAALLEAGERLVRTPQ